LYSVEKREKYEFNEIRLLRRLEAESSLIGLSEVEIMS